MTRGSANTNPGWNADRNQRSDRGQRNFKRHKIAMKTIDSGQPVLKYGQMIGIASQQIRAGDRVHLQNLSMCNSAVKDEFCTGTRPAPSAVPRALRRYLTPDDFEVTARHRLPKILYGFIAGAVETDASLRDNRWAFE
jgi:hypothetical protein